VNGRDAGPGGDPPRGAVQDDGWSSAVPEICVAAVLVGVAAAVGYVLAGLPGAVVAAAGAAVAALVVVRVLAPPSPLANPEHPYQARHDDAEAYPATFTGYWRSRSGLGDGIKSLPAYEAQLRPTLQRLLAARLAERHGVSLRRDPDAARRLLCPRPRDQGLWYWVDPARPPVTTGRQPGIPPRTLARLINRLERL
jgi:hypothetical protein